MTLPRRLPAFAAGLLLLMLALVFPLRQANAQDFLAGQIENLISSDTLQVEIEGLSGALTGNLRIESVTASDPQGVFLTASDVALDWSPLALVRSNVSVENLTAGQIVLERLPTGQPETPESEGGFTLPSITADIESIAIAEFVLGEAIAGVRARLRANASLALEDDPTSLDVRANIERLDQPGQVALAIAFAPDENQLVVDIQASEPAGGLVANLLELPGAPPVNLTVSGSGPLSDFMANGSLTVGTEEAATVTARVNDVENGRRVAASLNVAAERFVPEQFQPYVAGSTTLDTQVLLRDDGAYVIDQAVLASDALSLTAQGTLDPNGAANDLSIAVASQQGNAIPVSFGSDPNRTQLAVASLQGTLQGAFAAASIRLTAELPSAGFGEYVAQDVEASVASDGFDINAVTGPFALEATAQSVAAPEGVADRFLEGAVRITANGALTENGLVLNESQATTGVATAAVTGSAALNFAIFDLALSTAFDTSALSAAAIPIVGERIEVAAAVARTPDGALTAEDLSLQGTGVAVTGSATLANGNVSADISGALEEAGAVNPALAGQAEFSLTAEGPVEQPDVNLSLFSSGLTIGGRELSNLQVAARGTLNAAAPSGFVEISGTLDGEPLAGSAEVVTGDSGQRRINDLRIVQGPNSITGDLQLTDAFAPIGTLAVDIDDVGPLASLAGQEAAGDLNGTVELTQSADGFPIADVELVAASLTVAGNTLAGADIDLAVEDYLGAPFAEGTIRASAIDGAGVAVRDLRIALAREGDFTALDASTLLNAVPIDLAGRVRFAAEATTIELASLEAGVEGAPVSLAAPASVTIAEGATTLAGVALDVGGGSIVLDGSAGEVLDLQLRLSDVPVALANPFVENLDAAGTVSGTASVTGAAADPQAVFTVAGSDIATSQTRAAMIDAVDLAASGRYAAGTLALETASVDLGEGSIAAAGTIGETLDVRVELAAIPVALANGFVDGLDASGTISGTAVATGSLADPNATFNLSGTGITAAEIASAGIEPLMLDVAGRFADGTASIERANLDVGDGSLTASGTVGETLDVTVALTDIPVGLANGFVPDLGASGTISGTASATGSLNDPDAVFDLTGTGITTGEIALAGIEPLNLVAAGSFTDGTATIRNAAIDVGAGSLTASGTVGEALDIDVTANQIPVGLANGFVPDLGASGTVSGTASATGSLAEPNAVFDIAADDVTTAEIAASGVEPVDLRLAGTFADGSAAIETAVANVGEGSLTASGTVGETLDLDVALSLIPVGLVNGFVPDLEATGTISGTATATGTLSDPDAAFSLEGTGITTRQVAESGIAPLDLTLSGSVAGGTATIETATVTVGDGSLTASGTVGEALDLDVALNEIPVGLANGFVPDLGATGTVSGTASATGSLSDPSAEFALTGTGITTRQIAESGVDPLSLDVAGSFADGTATIANADLAVGTGSLTASGTVGEALDLDVALNEIPVGLANGFVPDLGAAGTISGAATATGSLADPSAEFALTGSGITTRQIAEAGVEPLSLDAAGSFANGTAVIEGVRLDVGDGSLTASGTVGEALDLQVALTDIPVALANGFVPDLDASGTISGTATATGSLADPSAAFALTGSGITAARIAEAGIAPLALDVAGSFADGTATIAEADVTVGTGSLSASGTVGESLDLDVALTEIPVGLANGFVPDLDASGTISGTASATGSLSDPTAEFALTGSGITTAQIAASGVAPLSLDLSGRFADGTATIGTAVVQVGAGSLTASGTVGETLDVDVELNQVPVGLANGFVPGLGAQGSISGTASATGSLADPSATFDISVSGVSVQQTRAAGAPPVNASLEGGFADGTVTLATATADVGGGTITASGTAGETLDLSVELAAIPASLASAVAPDIAPTGTIAGTVDVSGTTTDPSVAYDLTVGAFSIAQTRDAGVGPLDISAEGQFAGGVVTTTTSLSGSGIAFDVSGSVNVTGTPEFDLALDGTAPLSIANAILAEGGRSIEGTVQVDASVTGTAASPDVTGTISTAGAQFVDTGANLAINDITTTISLNGQTAAIDSFSAQLSSGGTITVSGTVGLAGGFPADLAIQVANGRYNDGELLSILLDADLTVTGDLTGTPLLAGTINAEEVNVLVPENLPTSLARIDVTHVNASPAVYQQQREISPEDSAGTGGGSGLALDITFNAPNEVFVRGRGLDIELGGSIRATGSIAAPSITGGFDLQRGRFRILSRRLDFERGRLSFTGDLVPTLDLLAQSDTGEVIVFIAVTGPANDPSFNFSSTPALPQDEVLARLIFGQGTSDLSPLQIAQLAEAAASLAGIGGSTGLLENLRSQLGVDDLDIRTTADGETAVGVGQYLNDNTYLGVDSTGRVSIDLDLGSGLKARGAVSAEGGGEVGLFYEGEF